jgi:two-component system, OmpR family, sensor kinase
MSPGNIPETQKPDRLLTTLQRLLELPTIDVVETMHKTAQLVTQALGVEKIDVFLHDPESRSLVALGTSMTLMGNKEKLIGLDRLPLADGGRIVEVYLTGQPYWTGEAHRDPYELTGMTEELGIKSEIAVPLEINAERRGVLFASSSLPDFLTEQDLRFLEAVTHWVGVVFHRAELAEQHTKAVAEQARQLAAEELLTVVAHDLGNYMTPLKARLDLLEQRTRRDMHELEMARHTLRRLNRLVSDLLDVTRLEKGAFFLNLQTVNLVDILEEVVPIWSTSEHPIEVQSPDDLTITADPDRIQQVLENLLSNATTYADPNTPVRVVLAQEQHMDTTCATLTVSNQGPEIPAELQTSLFQPFVKGKLSKGLGLGLSIASRIAHTHQGNLTVQSEAGKATTFTLSLPLDVT